MMNEISESQALQGKKQKDTLAEWFKKRKEKKYQEDFESGYNYAAGMLLSGQYTPYELDSIQSGVSGDNYCRFDNGMNHAIQKAIDIGMVEDNRV